MQVAAPEPMLLSIADAVRLTSISRSELYRLMGSGRLKAVKRGVRTFIPTEELRRFLATLPAADIRKITWENASRLYRHPVPDEVIADPNAF